MELTVDIAKSIVNEVQKILNYPINVIDNSGNIIWSSNNSRIGTLHEAAIIMLRNHDDVFEVQSKDQYLGSKEGINLSIDFQGKIIGVVGLTGPVCEVKAYGLIIKKMTEIMLQQIYYRQILGNKEIEKVELLVKWLTSSIDSLDDQFFLQARYFGLNLQKPKSLILVTDNAFLNTIDMEENSFRKQNQFVFLENYIKTHKSMYFFKYGLYWIIVVDSVDKSTFRKEFSSFIEEMNLGCDGKFYYGADYCDNNRMSECYRRALASIKVSIDSQGQIQKLFEDIEIGLITSGLGKDVKKVFMLKVLCDLVIPENEYLLRVLDAYYRCNGSIQKTADELYLHKNTIQYQLNKIKRIIGRDPRVINSIPLIYLALEFHKELSSGKII